MLKVGLVGVGGISGAHIPAWEAMEGCKLVALCDVRPEQMQDHADKHCYTDFDAMLEQENLDILDICLPTYLHADFAIKAMNKGVHVLCEKPISLKVEDVKRVYAAAEANHVKFMVAHVLRFWKEFVILKELVDKQTYGKVLSGSMFRLGQFPGWTWDNWMKDEDRSGLVPFDLHIHDLDFIVYTFGKPKKMNTYRVRRPEQDYISAIYEFGDFIINCESSWYAGHYPFIAGFRFQFEKAVVAYENGELIAYLSNCDEPTKLAEREASATSVINLSDLGPYANEIQYFANCVLNDQKADKVKREELETVIRLLDNFR